MSAATGPALTEGAQAQTPRGKILAMSAIAGAVVTNIYCNQPILPLISQGFRVGSTQVDLVAGATLLGFATGLFFLLPLGDGRDRKKLVLLQVILAFFFAAGAALSTSLWMLVVASYLLGIVSCVPQQLVPFAAVMSRPSERGRSVGTVVSGIMVGILAGRALSGAIGSHWGWRAVFGFEAALMVPIYFIASALLPTVKPTTDLAYPKLLATMPKLLGKHQAIRDSVVIQSLLWACFNAFWVNLAAMLSEGPLHLGSQWAGSFGIIGAAGAFAASLGGRAVDRVGPRRVIGLSIALVVVAYAVLALPAASLLPLVAGVILLDLGVQSALVSNQARAFAADPAAQGRINSIYMTSTFVGGAIGAVVSGWLMARFGWPGVCAFGVAVGLVALAAHGAGGRRIQK